jgi:ArsR family transcriptional regulator
MSATIETTNIDAALDAARFLSDRNRLRILSVLTRAETCVCDLIDELELSQSLVSYHLGKLRTAGLVRARRDAQWIYYSLDPSAWERMTAPLAGLLNVGSLPPEAAFGASHRCDLVPPDSGRGACDNDACEDV